LYELAPISELMRLQWLPQTKDIDLLEKAVCEFLGIKSPLETLQIAVNFRHNQELEPEDTALICWLKRVENLVKNQSLPKFEREKLIITIPEILNYTQNPEDIAKIPALLNSLGIYFVIVPHLSKTYLDGATFMIGENPVIALTLRYNRLDSFWFTLMHELAHIVANHQGIYLDDLSQLEDNPQEKEANQISIDWLLNSQALDQFVKANYPHFSSKAIEKFAHSQNRHGGIIIGRLHYDGKIPYKNHRKYLVKIAHLL